MLEEKVKAYKYLHLSKRNLRERLGHGRASAMFPGLDLMAAAVGSVDRWIDIAPAQLQDPPTDGTLLLTETEVWFADLSGAPLAKIECANVVRVSRTNTRRLFRKAAKLTLVGGEGSMTFLVGRAAAAELQARLAILSRWPHRERTVSLADGKVEVLFVLVPAAVGISWEVANGDQAELLTCVDEFVDRHNAFADEFGAGHIDREEAEAEILYT